jgi:hypothetical protein
MVRNLVGQPVKGADFFNRAREQEELWDFLERDHVLLLAPRRVGKTSLLHYLAVTAPERGIRAAYCSAADAKDELRFIEQLLVAIGKLEDGAKALNSLKKSRIGKVLKKVRKVEVVGFGFELDPASADWAAVGDALTSVLSRQQGRWLLLVDELPMFILNLLRTDPTAARAREFLGWFRSVRQRSDLEGGIRWLLAGSIGLDSVTARLNLGDTINDLHIYHLGAFSEKAADGLLRELSRTHDLPLEAEERAHMIRRVGWLIPYHLQLLFSELRSQCSKQECEPTIEAIDAAFETLLSPVHKGYFDYWRQRLYEELGKPDAGFALALLGAAARDQAGATTSVLLQVMGGHLKSTPERNEKLRFLLDVLEGDGYLVAEEDRFRFRSPLVREFWLRRVLP